MKLISAAIKCRPTDSNYDMVFTAKRHSDIFAFFADHHIYVDRNSAVQGFMTDTNQFVDRYEAKQIAVEAQQLIVPESETYAELFSEDVW